eukprot:g23024.t1
MLRRRRIAKAKAIVGQLLLEAHGFTDAEVEEFTLQYMNLSEQLVFKPGDDQQAKITMQTDQSAAASQHPWLTGAKLVKQRKELMQIIPKYGLEGSKDGKSAAADPNKLMLQLEAGWRKNGASDEDLVELKQYAGEMLKTFESWEKDGWTSSATGIEYDVQLYVTGDMKWLHTVCGQKSAGADHFRYMCLCHKNDRGDLSRMGHPMRDSATADKTTPGMAHDLLAPLLLRAAPPPEPLLLLPPRVPLCDLLPGHQEGGRPDLLHCPTRAPLPQCHPITHVFQRRPTNPD